MSETLTQWYNDNSAGLNAGVQEGLWWLPGGEKWRNRVRQVLCLGALATLIVAFEGRVVFPAFGQYIQLHPPWNYLAVTIALYGFAALMLMYLGGTPNQHLYSCAPYCSFHSAGII